VTTNSDPPNNPHDRLARLRSGGPVFGLLQTLPGATLTELAVWSGFDFVILDCEHGVVDEQAHVASLQAISGTGAFALVRVQPGNLGAVGRYLDFGAAGIMMSNVNTAADAAAFIAAATLGPEGTRSSTGNAVRAARYGTDLQSPREEAPHEKSSRRRPLLLAIIESAEAIANIAAISATPGLDGFVIGPYDLAASLSCTNDFSASVYESAFAKVEDTAVQARLLLGCIAHPGFSVERLIGAGHRFILAGVDILALRDGLRSLLAAARGSRT
jgi:4-hydroxy-2-oxoheptanedioate aldolase